MKCELGKICAMHRQFTEPLQWNCRNRHLQYVRYEHGSNGFHGLSGEIRNVPFDNVQTEDCVREWH
jgi:hypothetical protein